MADAPADPRCFTSSTSSCARMCGRRAIPAAAAWPAPKTAGGVEKLRGYMREKARQLGIERHSLQRRGLSRPLRVRPEHGHLPRGGVVPLRNRPRTSMRSWRRIIKNGGACQPADAPARPAAAEALRAAAAHFRHDLCPGDGGRDRAAIAIIRVSGPDAARAVSLLAGGFRRRALARRAGFCRP